MQLQIALVALAPGSRRLAASPAALARAPDPPSLQTSGSANRPERDDEDRKGSAPIVVTAGVIAPNPLPDVLPSHNPATTPGCSCKRPYWQCSSTDLTNDSRRTSKSGSAQCSRKNRSQARCQSCVACGSRPGNARRIAGTESFQSGTCVRSAVTG